MPYIKISDPNIIDLAAWHQVINVVNQHSDSLSAITNNFGAQGSSVTDWSAGSNITHEFDPGSQKILYGREKISTEGADKNLSTTGDHMFYKTIEITKPGSTIAAFDAAPIITASATFGSQVIDPPSTTNANVVCTVIAVTNDTFTVRLVNARSTTSSPIPLTGYFYVSWIAIGPK